MDSITIIKRFTSCGTLNSINSAAALIALFAKLLVKLKDNIGIRITGGLNTNSRGTAGRAVRSTLVVYTTTNVFIYLVYLLFTKPVLSVVGAGPRLLSRTILCVGIFTLNVPTATVCGFNGNILDTHKSAGHPVCCLTFTKVLGIVLGLVFIVMFRVTTIKITATDTVTRCISKKLVLVRLVHHSSVYGIGLHGLHCRGVCKGKVLCLNIPSNLRGTVFTVTGLFIRSNVGSFSTVVISKGTTTTGTSGLVCGIVFTFCITYSDFVDRG